MYDTASAFIYNGRYDGMVATCRKSNYLGAHMTYMTGSKRNLSSLENHMTRMTCIFEL